MGLFGLGKKKKHQEAVKNIIASKPKEAEVKKETVKENLVTEPAKKAPLAKPASPAKATPAAEKVSAPKEQSKAAAKSAPVKASAIKSTSTKPAEKPTTAKPIKMQDRVSDIIKAKNTQTAPKPQKTEVNPTETSAYTGRFEINRSKDGKKFFFNLYASNKVGIATSQMYSSAQSALNGIKSVIANAGKAPIEDQSLKKYEELPYPKWEIYIDNGGKYRFRLNASNGSCVCHSQGYTTKNACKNGIDSIIRSSQNAEIDKTYISNKDEK